MKTYKIELVFTDPYIAQRNGGNRTLSEGLSLDNAKKELLNKHNELFEKTFSNLAEAERYYKKHNTIDGVYKDGRYYRLDYDSRIYRIEEEGSF